MQFTLTERFAAPPAVVSAALADVEGFRAWMPNLVRIEKLTEGDFGAGTRFREVRKMFGREAVEEFEVLAFEPGRHVELYVDGRKGSSGSGEYRFRYDLSGEDETVMTVHGEIGGMGKVAGLLGRIFLPMMRRAIAKDHAALKAHVEASVRAAR